MEIIKNTLIITVLGIGFVFAFLLIQVFMTNLMTKFASKYAYLLPEPDKQAAKRKAAPAAQEDESELLAVISAAIRHHEAN
jgi:oxaloacetate decarboxylase gamma subunit